jgi:hypothetical protein
VIEPAALAAVVGRITDPDALPGGAALIAKATRKGSLRWFMWATAGTITKPVKTVAATEAPDGKAVYEDGTFARVHLKATHPDGRAFVVRYVEERGAWKADAAYVLTKTHRCTLEDGSTHEWTTEHATLDAATVSELKDYTKGDDDR